MQTQSNTQYSISTIEQNQLLALGRGHGWAIRVLGYAPMPTHPFKAGGWLIAPGHLDSSPLPERTLTRIRAIYAAGIRPKGFVVVHEAPRLLAEKARGKDTPSLGIASIRNGRQIRQFARAGAGTLGVAALASGAVVLGIAALLLFLPTLLIVGAIAIDPILVAVMDDGAWVEIDRWDA